MAVLAREIPAGAVPDVSALSPDDATVLRQIHRAVAQVSDDLEKFRFNSAVARIRELSNTVQDMSRDGSGAGIYRHGVEVLAQLINPLTPHIAGASVKTSRSRGRRWSTHASARGCWRTP